MAFMFTDLGGMTVDPLYKEYLKAVEHGEACAEREAETKLKMIRARRAAEKAQAAHDVAFDANQQAFRAVTDAYTAWRSARAGAQEGGTP